MRRLVSVTVGVVVLIASQARANPPEYLAGSQVPAENAAQIPSPIEEVSVQPPGWRLAQFMTEPFFRDLTLNLDPRFYYRSVDQGHVLSEAFTAGGLLGLTTGWWRDTLQFGLAGYTTQPLATGPNPGNSGLLRENGQGFSVVGQAWAKVKLGPATATLFRQEMELPFINGDDSKMIPNLFEAYRVNIKPCDFFRFGFGYITREKDKTSAEFRPMSEVAGVPGVDRGTSVAGFLLGSKEQGYIGAINELTWDLLNIAYVEAGRTWQLADDLQFRGQLQFVDQQSVGEALLGGFATQLYGASVDASYRSAIITVSFTSTANGAAIKTPFGGAPVFNSRIISDFDSAGENAVGVGLTYTFDRIGLTGLKAFADYVHGELPAGHHEDEVNVTGDYRIEKGPLKNIWLRVRYARNMPSDQLGKNEIRAILNYTLAF